MQDTYWKVFMYELSLLRVGGQKLCGARVRVGRGSVVKCQWRSDDMVEKRLYGPSSQHLKVRC